MSIIEELRQSSGKSIKFKVIELTKLTDGYDNALFLSNATSKICIVMSTENIENYSLRKNESFFVQNLEFVESIEEIPFFKVSAKAKNCFKVSRKKEKTCIEFSNKEIENAKKIDINQYLQPSEPQATSSSKVDVDPVIQKDNLCLHEFCKSIPAKLKTDCYVEVNSYLKMDHISLVSR